MSADLNDFLKERNTERGERMPDGFLARLAEMKTIKALMLALVMYGIGKKVAKWQGDELEATTPIICREEGEGAKGAKGFFKKLFFDPVQVEYTPKEGSKGAASHTESVPWTYAPDFQTTELEDEEVSEEKMTEAIDEAMSALAQKIHVLGVPAVEDISKKHYQHRHQDWESLKKLEIESINIVGFASPEGKNEDSILPGEIDSENVELAQKRAKKTKEILVELFREKGFDENYLQAIDFKTLGQEIQFAPEEIAVLKHFAQEYFDKDLDQINILDIFQLIADYNDGKLNNKPEFQDIKAGLDRVVDDKRKVTIEIKFKNGEKHAYVIAIPVLLLALLYEVIRRRRRQVSSG